MNEILAGLMLEEWSNQSLPRSKEREMKCPVCQKFGLTSTVYPGWVRETCLGWSPFYDEEGNYHSHDPNRKTQKFKCSRSHIWVESWYVPCWCGKSKEEKSIAIEKPKWKVTGEFHLGGGYFSTTILNTKESAEFTAEQWRKENIEDGGFRFTSVVVSSSWDPEPDFESKEYKELFEDSQHVVVE